MSVDCPEHLLPRNARAAAKLAAANGWKWEAKLAAGFPPDGADIVWSVLLRASKDGVRLAGVWDGPEKSQLGWHGGWRRDERGFITGVSWTEFSDEIKGWPVKDPTAAAQEKTEAEMAEQLRAISALRPIAWPIAVLPLGTKDRACKGRVKNPDWPGWLPCANYALPNGPLCSDCSGGVIYSD